MKWFLQKQRKNCTHSSQRHNWPQENWYKITNMWPILFTWVNFNERNRDFFQPPADKASYSTGGKARMAPDFSRATCKVVKQSSEGKEGGGGSRKRLLTTLWLKGRAGEQTDLLHGGDTHGTRERPLREKQAAVECGHKQEFRQEGERGGRLIRYQGSRKTSLRGHQRRGELLDKLMKQESLLKLGSAAQGRGPADERQNVLREVCLKCGQGARSRSSRKLIYHTRPNRVKYSV